MSTATLQLHSPLARAREKRAKGFFSRFYDALIEARMRQAMRELAMHRHLIPQDVVQETGYTATVTTDGVLPFTR
jgi:hypothetical protein